MPPSKYHYPRKAPKPCAVCGQEFYLQADAPRRRVCEACHDAGRTYQALVKEIPCLRCKQIVLSKARITYCDACRKIVDRERYELKLARQRAERQGGPVDWSGRSNWRYEVKKDPSPFEPLQIGMKIKDDDFALIFGADAFTPGTILHDKALACDIIVLRTEIRRVEQ